MTTTPVLIYYAQGDEVLQIRSHYLGGLGGAFRAGVERGGVRMLCPQPLWEAVHETATALTDQGSATFSYLAANVDGQWDNFDAVGTFVVQTLALGADNVLYVGGNFVDWNGDVNQDRITKWNGTSWSALLTGLTGICYHILLAPNGDLYACGEFTNAGGVATADYIARWNGSAWNAVGDPNSGGATITRIYRMAFDSTGNLYIVGTFTNLAGIAAADYVAKWNGTAWAAVGTPSSGATVTNVTALAIDSLDNIYVGGNFLNLAGVAAADYVAKWNGSAWVAMGTGFNDYVWTLTQDRAGRLYAGGGFTLIGGGGATMRAIARWNGTTWEELGGGANGAVLTIAEDPRGNLWLGGIFTQAGGIDFINSLAKWNGLGWEPVDFDPPGAAATNAIIFRERVDGFDAYLGFDTTGTGTYGGAGTVTNGSTAPVHPKVTIKRSGGTSARLEKIENYTAGRILFFDLLILNGETITIDTETGTVESDFRGNVLYTLLDGSDFTDFVLLPGANTVRSYVSRVGNPTVTANLIWREKFWSADDSVV